MNWDEFQKEATELAAFWAGAPGEERSGYGRDPA